jgi:TRAP-type mannitol/chloroaromatic compound transport system permease small subunit
MKSFVLQRVLPPLDAIGYGLAILAMVQTVLLNLVMIYEVIVRYGFNAPTLWANDMTYMTNGTLFLFGAAWTLRMNAHVRIDFLSTMLPVRFQHLINAAFYVCLFLPLIWYVGNSQGQKAWRAWVKGELEGMSAWEPVVWPFYTGITIGIAGLGIQVIAEAIRHGIGVVDPKAVPRPGTGEHVQA